MLKQRVITAIVLLVILLAALLSPSPWPLVVLLTVLAGCALWEWLRLTWPAPGRAGPIVLGILAAALLLWLAAQWLSPAASGAAVSIRDTLVHWLIPAVSLLWILVATTLVWQGHTQSRQHGGPLSLFGVLAVGCVWTALVLMYVSHGAWFLVSLLALIWFADIAAYFAGKAFGRHKLAPKVSPGKTWEGAVGGVLAAAAWVMLTQLWPGSFGHVLAARWPWWGVLLIAIFLAAISIVGDLFESLLKRRAGVKDSSQLLPGHGGVYDRIDALLPVAPIALLLTAS